MIGPSSHDRPPVAEPRDHDQRGVEQRDGEREDRDGDPDHARLPDQVEVEPDRREQEPDEQRSRVPEEDPGGREVVGEEPQARAGERDRQGPDEIVVLVRGDPEERERGHGGDAGASPSMLSSRFRALVTTTTHTIVSGRSRTAMPNTPAAPRHVQGDRRGDLHGELDRGLEPSGVVDQAQAGDRDGGHQDGRDLDRAPAATTPVTPSPAATAAPPRYGVGSTWVL